MNYFKGRAASLKFALTGIIDVLKSEANLKIHLLAAITAVSAGGYFAISRTEWCLVILCIVAVLSAETFNTSIEHLTDLVSPEKHPLAKRTKDAAAGAVLWIAIGALLVGLIIFLPKVFDLFLID